MHTPSAAADQRRGGKSNCCCAPLLPSLLFIEYVCVSRHYASNHTHMYIHKHETTRLPPSALEDEKSAAA